MAMLQPERQSGLDPQQGYKRVLWIAGLDDSDFSRNDEQEIQDLERQMAFDTVLNDGAIMSGLATSASVLLGNTIVTCDDGLVYTHGRTERVPGGPALHYTGLISDNTKKVYLQWQMDQVDNTIDPTIVNPNTGEEICNRFRVTTQLATSSPDAFDEEFDTFIVSGTNPPVPVYRDGTQNAVPLNTLTGIPWVLVSGAASPVVGIGAPKFGRSALKLNHQQNLAMGAPDTLIQIPNAGVCAAGTPQTYVVTVWMRTVYGQTDSSGAYVDCGRFGRAYFTTSGGAQLLGDFTRYKFTFTSDGSTSPFTVSVGITAVSPSTEILVDGLLITSAALDANPNDVILDRHFIPILQGTSGGQMTPIVVPRTKLSLADLGGTIDASRVTYESHSSHYHDIGEGGYVNTALDALTDQRALLNGDADEVFSISDATAGVQATSARQVQSGALSYALDTGIANAYAATPALLPLALTDGMEVAFKVANANSGPATLNWATLGIRTIVNNDLSALIGGELVPDEIVVLRYNLTSPSPGVWQLLTKPVIAILNFVETSIGGNQALGHNAEATIMSQAVTLPSGGNFRLLVTYTLAILDGSLGAGLTSFVGAQVTDGSNVWGQHGQNVSNASSAASTNDVVLHASELSPVTYAGGTTVTISVQAGSAVAGSQAHPTINRNGIIFATEMVIAVLASN